MWSFTEGTDGGVPFRLSVSPWYCATYPLNTISIRSICVAYLRPVGLKVGGQADGALPLLSGHSLRYNLSPNFISTAYYAIKIVYKVEGLAGLYRGFTLAVCHLALSDGMRYSLARCIYSPLTNLCSIILMKLRKQSVESATPTSAAPGSSELAHILMKRFTDIVTYPLITCISRQIVYEGPGSLGFPGVFELTWRYDGISGLFQGFVPHICARIIDDAVEYYSCRFGQKFKLTAAQTFTLGACCKAIFGTLTTPFNQLATIQQCQSSMPGLCEYTSSSSILAAMPWKVFMLQFCLSLGILSLNLTDLKQDD